MSESSSLDLSLTTRKFSKLRCKRQVPISAQYVLCTTCRERNRRSRRRVMKRDSNGGQSTPHSKCAGEDVDTINTIEPTPQDDTDTLITKTRMAEVENVSFRGTSLVVLDSTKTPNLEHIQGLASEVCSLTGYRFTVHDNRGDNAIWYKSRYWCSRDQERRKKYELSTAPGAKHRNYPGRQRFACKSGLTISYRIERNATQARVRVNLRHAIRHAHISID